MARAQYRNVAVSRTGTTVITAPNAQITLYEAGTTTPLAATIYAGPTGGATLTNPFFADADGNFVLYLDQPQDIKVVATGVGIGTVTLDFERVLPAAGDMVTNGRTAPTTLAGGLSVTNNSATVWAQTIENTNASGRSLNIKGPDGLDLFTVMRVGGVDQIGIGLQDTPTYLTENRRLFVAQTSAANVPGMSNFLLTATGGADSGAMRAVFEQNTSGATWGRAGEFQSRRTVGNNALWGIEVGTHSSVNVTALGDHAGIVGVYIANQEAGWLGAGTGVRGDAGILIQGDLGYKSSIVARDVDSTTVLLRGVAFTTGNDIKGDMMLAGRLYSQIGGSTYRIGTMNYATAPTGITDGGIHFDTTAGRLALHLGAATGGAAYRPVLISPDGGGGNNAGVGICVTPTALAAQAGVIAAPLQVGQGGTIAVLKVASLVTPPSGSSSIGPLTDEAWYFKTSAGTEVRLLGATTTKVIPQAQVVNTSNQSVADNTPTALAFTSEDWDVGGFHDNATNNNRLTAPTTARYRVTARAGFAANTAGVRSLSLRKNGTSFAENIVTAASAGATGLMITAGVDLTAGEYVDCMVYQNSGAALNIVGAAPNTPTFDIVQQL